MKIVYGSETCHKCKILVKKYEEEKVDFEYVDVATLSNKELIDVSKESNTMSLPIVLER